MSVHPIPSLPARSAPPRSLRPQRQLLRPHFRRLLAPAGYRGRALHGIDTEHTWKIVFRGTKAESMRVSRA
ncbi:BZ3500_MvSof-1268-A1-R1_Chr11-1g03186 [Microbotryum saponariae]|uniref:BZ3500_MvSof-1268-A1-R1_Chr11-1g03186 protein n=1 Tax=Microbotryum saponariae TaxID=289078 RepID=A0A2X0NCS2_9BASI|nr:BZ3501_MvSof-1269-A2-R1_Chr11g02761 [Microbotryum saponariae]SDA03746.1 BZ3500_MvSof-1268-A1-R1_Chr11-1g03186 [Microbotryum saponariae]